MQYTNNQRNHPEDVAAVHKEVSALYDKHFDLFTETNAAQLFEEILSELVSQEANERERLIEDLEFDGVIPQGRVYSGNEPR
jgi:hypothetical protein